MPLIPQLRQGKPGELKPVDPLIQKLRKDPRDKEIAQRHGMTTDQLEQIVSEFGAANYFLIIDCFQQGVSFNDALQNARQLIAIEGQ